jgi:deoxyribodipyrimidine photo-lyase
VGERPESRCVDPGIEVAGTGGTSVRVHWHRRDLRAVDSGALAAATADDSVVPVFVFDRDVLDHASPPRVAFLLDALESLRATYRSLGSDLLLARGDPTEELPSLVEEKAADGVSWEADYSGLAVERDERVTDALGETPVTVYDDAVCHPPGSITTSGGDNYSVFSYYGRKWRDRPKEQPHPAPAADALAAVEGEALPTLSDLGLDAPAADVPPAGTDAARELLDAFLDDDIHEYENLRELPAADGTSRLSPHLRFGTIGCREVYAGTVDAESDCADHGCGDAPCQGVETFREQLAWREFYLQVIADRPELVTRSLFDFERPIEWRSAPEDLAAWKEGRTGVPIVDAGMRQLRDEAWMHNRLRMIVASFLTKDLLIDWRAGYAWFRERLVDHDPANDAGGWQWAASTGVDAQPYFRVFNPWTQGDRHDPDATYITRHVPELRDAAPADIHGWDELREDERDAIAPAYPAPIVDHGRARDRAIAAFEDARADE